MARAGQTAYRAATLVGRDDEVGVIRLAAMRAHQGGGGTVLVLGEAGVGKSRLVAEGARIAGSLGMAVLRGRAVESAGPLRPVAEALLSRLREDDRGVRDLDELRPFRPALSRLLPGWATAHPVTEVPQGVDPVLVLGEGVYRLLRVIGGEAGCLLVIEDLHDADPDTLALLEYLASCVPAAPILIIVSARSDEHLREPVRRMAGQVAVTQLALRRMDAATAARLASACAGGAVLPDDVAAFLVDAAGGLPFLIEELLTGMVEAGNVDPAAGWKVRGPLSAQLPQTLVELVGRRLARLTPGEQRVLVAAAVVGHGFDLNLLGRVSGLDEESVVAGLRAALAAFLLDRDAAFPGGLGWRHPLVRDAVLARLLPAERERLAAHAAAVMHARDPNLTSPHAALIAELYAQGGDQSRARDVLLSLARQATAAGALQTAGMLLARAGTSTEVAVERVRLLALTGQGHEAIAAGEAALPTATGSQRVELCLNLARAAITAARWDAALAYIDRAGRDGAGTDRAGRIDDPRVPVLAADAAHGAGRVEEAAELARAAVAAAERAGLPAVACEALEVLGRCARGTDPQASAAEFRRAADLAEAHGLVPWRIRALFGLGAAEVLEHETSAHFDVARELALDAGMLAEVAGINLIRLSGHIVINGPVASMPMADDTAAFAGSLRLTRIQAMALLGRAEGEGVAGRADAMRATLQEAARLAPDLPDVPAGSAAAIAMAALLDRDLARAATALDEAFTAIERHPSSAPLHHGGLFALVHTLVGDDGSARERMRRSPLLVRAVNRGGLCYADAVALGREGRADEATAMVTRADRTLPAQHWWRRLLQVLVCEAMLADGWGEPVARLRVLLDEFDRADDTRLAGLCRDLLRRAGAPVPRRGRGQSAVPRDLRAMRVTSREMDVLVLVAEGLTNAQIAQRLFLSPRTIETHVASLLAKTGRTARGDLSTLITP